MLAKANVLNGSTKLRESLSAIQEVDLMLPEGAITTIISSQSELKLQIQLHQWHQLILPYK